MTPHDNLTATIPEKPFARLVAPWPATAQFAPTLRSARAAAPSFRHTPAERSEKRLAPDPQTPSPLPANRAAALTCGPRNAQIPIAERVAPPPRPLPAISCLGAFRTPASERAERPWCRRPKTCTEHRTCTEKADYLCPLRARALVLCDFRVGVMRGAKWLVRHKMATLAWDLLKKG